MKTEITDNGYTLVRFTDGNGNSCMLQESSVATEPMVWLGRTMFRMHLTQEHVKDLLPNLSHFVETGELVAPTVTLHAPDPMLEERQCFEALMREQKPLFPLELSPGGEYKSAGTQHQWEGFKLALRK